MANYDPSKKYTWSPEDKFVLTGSQFGLILNALRGVLNTPEASKILLASRANDAIEEVMAAAVEEYIVKEAEEEVPVSQLRKM
jgi:hypothetical protein